MRQTRYIALLLALLVYPATTRAMIASTGAGGTPGVGTAVTSVTVGALPSFAANDVCLMVAHSSVGVTLASTSSPQAWTAVGTLPTGNATNGTLGVWYRVMTGGEGAPVVSAGSSGKMTVNVWCFSGVDTASPIAVAGAYTTQAANTTYTGATVSLPVTSCMLLLAGGSQDDNTWGTWGGGLTTGDYDVNAAGTPDTSIFLGWDGTPNGTASGTSTAPSAVQLTLGGDAGYHLSFALRPGTTTFASTGTGGASASGTLINPGYVQSDAGFPVTWNTDGSGPPYTYTSPAFTTGGTNRILVVGCFTDDGAGTSESVSDNNGLTWTLAKEQTYNPPTSTDSWSRVWTAKAASQITGGTVTVTANQGGAKGGCELYAVQGADMTTWVGATAGGAATDNTTITANAAGSRIFWFGGEFNAEAGATYPPQTGNVTDFGRSDTLGGALEGRYSGQRIADTAASTLYTVGSTRTPVSSAVEIVAVEILKLSAADPTIGGSSTGGASVTAALTVQKDLASTATAASSVTAALTLPKPLAATATAGASATADLALPKPLASAATAGASWTAALTTAIPLGATVTGASTVTSALTNRIQLASALVAGASVSGSLPSPQLSTATSTGAATVTGALTGAPRAASAIAGGSSVVAALATAIPLGSNVAGAATQAAGVTTSIRAAGLAAGASVVAGQLTAAPRFAATVTGGASSSAAIASPAVPPASASGAAALTATLTNGIRLAATLTAGATVGATLTVPKPLAASLTAAATMTPTLTLPKPLAASLTGGAVSSGTFVGAPRFASTVTGAATAEALLAGGASFTPTTVRGSASMSGNLVTAIPLAAGAAGGGVVVAPLAVPKAVAGAASGAASATGTLTTSVRAAGALAGAATLTALLVVPKPLAAPVLAGAMLSGPMTARAAFQAALTGAASVSGTTVSGSSFQAALVAGANVVANLSNIWPNLDAAPHATAALLRPAAAVSVTRPAATVGTVRPSVTVAPR